jgi:hypothetical protein
VFKVGLPYPYVTGQLEAGFEGGEGKLSISPDGGKTWQPAAAGDVSSLVKQRYDVWIKAEFAGALASLKFEGIVEHNRGALPYLLPGANAVTVSGTGAVSVSYAYQEATGPANRKRWEGQGVTYGEAKTVTKSFAQLPATFTVDVGGNTPPRMLYLELSSTGK